MAAEGTVEIHTGAGPLAVASAIIIRYSLGTIGTTTATTLGLSHGR